jgi:hypothetical protein
MSAGSAREEMRKSAAMQRNLTWLVYEECPVLSLAMADAKNTGLEQASASCARFPLPARLMRFHIRPQNGVNACLVAALLPEPGSTIVFDLS